MPSSSFLSCLKKGGGIDVHKAFHYFDELDRDNQAKTLSQSRSSSLLDMISTRSSIIDPQWFIAKWDSDEQGHLSLFLEAFNFNNDDDEPIAKRHRGPRVVSLEVLQADGTRCKAVPTDTHGYFIYVLHPMIRCKKFHRTFRHRFQLPYDQFLVLWQRQGNRVGFLDGENGIQTFHWKY